MNSSIHSTPPEPPRFQPRMVRCFSAISIAILTFSLVCSARGWKGPRWMPRPRGFSLDLSYASLRPRAPFPLAAARIRNLFPSVALHPLPATAPMPYAAFFQPFHFKLLSPPPALRSRLLAAGFSVPSRQSLAADVIHRHAAGTTDSIGWGIPTTWLAAVAMGLAIVGTVLTFVAAR